MKKYKVGSRCITEIRNLVRGERGALVIQSTNVKGTIVKVIQRYGGKMYYVDIDNSGTVCRRHHEVYLIPVFTKIKIL